MLCSRSYLKFRGGNVEVISDAILFVYPLRGALATKAVRVTREGVICAHLANPYRVTNLRSPTLIIAPFSVE